MAWICNNDEKSAAIWDMIAKPCSNYPRRSPYADEFLQRSGIEPGDTVFDMGCGTGTLCLPLADDGHRVFCGDYSEKTLQMVQDTIEEEGIELITLRKMSFLEDWDRLDIPVCDYAFASRSLFEVDPYIVIPKLSAYAKKKVCITVHVNFTDHTVSGFEVKGNEMREYFKACINAVIDAGYMPHVDYMTFGTCHENNGWAFISWSV